MPPRKARVIDAGRRVSPPRSIPVFQGLAMLVKMLVMQAGRDFVRDRGVVVEVADAEALRMIAAGIAEPVRVAPVERATPRQRGERAVVAP